MHPGRKGGHIPWHFFYAWIAKYFQTYDFDDKVSSSLRMPKFSALVGLNHLTLMKHVSLSVLVRAFAGIILLDIEPRGSLSIVANCYQMPLLSLPAFVQVMSVVAAKIVLLWSIIAPHRFSRQFGFQ